MNVHKNKAPIRAQRATYTHTSSESSPKMLAAYLETPVLVRLLSLKADAMPLRAALTGDESTGALEVGANSFSLAAAAAGMVMGALGLDERSGPVEQGNGRVCVRNSGAGTRKHDFQGRLGPQDTGDILSAAPPRKAITPALV